MNDTDPIVTALFVAFAALGDEIVRLRAEVQAERDLREVAEGKAHKSNFQAAEAQELLRRRNSTETTARDVSHLLLRWGVQTVHYDVGAREWSVTSEESKRVYRRAELQQAIVEMLNAEDSRGRNKNG